MPNKIKPKRSFTPNSVPLTTDLTEVGELAINWADGIAYTRNSAGQIVSVTLGGGGGGGGSGEDTALRAFFVPPAPTSVTATAGNAQAVVSWTAPTVLSQTPITDYVVQYSSNSGSTWTTFSDGTSTATSATVTGLTNGTAYTFRVAAVSGVGTGAYSTASSAVTPATFTPASVTGLQLWLDASDAGSLYDATSGGSLVTADGGVARWEDKSGNGRHATQSTSGSRPLRKTAIQGGKGVLRFDGSNDSLSVDSVASTLSGDDTVFTMFIVAKNTGSNLDRVVFSAGSSSLANTLIELALASDQLTYFRRDDSGSSSGGANASARTTGFGVIGVVQQAASHTMYLNGASVHSASANIGSVTANRATVGCLRRVSDQSFFEGDIAELCIYNAALSDTDRAAVESYLISKWGIA